jgi:hypothetical protein
MGEFFGRNIQNRQVEIVGTESVVTIQEDNKRFEYHVDNISIDQVKELLSIPSGEGSVNLGRQAGRMRLTLIAMAFEQYKGDDIIKGEFKISDIIKLWKVSDGTKTRRAIKDLISSLYASSFTRFRQIGPEEIEFTITRLITSITKHEKKGNETVYTFTLNKDAIGKSADWIKLGYVPKEWQADGYLRLPLRDLSEKNQSAFYLNFRERVRLVGTDKKHKFVTTTVGKSMLLKTWFKFDQDRLKRRTFCRNTIIESLEKAKQDGELPDYKYKLPENKGWQEIWEIEFTKLNRKKL